VIRQPGGRDWDGRRCGHDWNGGKRGGGELGAAERASETPWAVRHAEHRSASTAGYSRRCHWRGGRGVGGDPARKRERSARTRWHELRWERLGHAAVGAGELCESMLHLQSLAAPSTPHLEDTRRRRHVGGRGGATALCRLVGFQFPSLFSCERVNR
jgi:hypothetical protein